mgnify:CR=1 FL=1
MDEWRNENTRFPSNLLITIIIINTVIKSECLYGAETLILNGKADIENIEKKRTQNYKKKPLLSKI